MRALALVAILLFPPVADAKRSVAYCPELPPRSGLEWKYLEGGDFIGCIATRKTDGARLFGVYIGQHPMFVIDESKRKAKGVVGGRSTYWQLPGPSSDEGVVLESHLDLDLDLDLEELDPPLQAVVWVYALPRARYGEAFRTIARMRFRGNWLERPD